jgi:nitrogen fixation protein FixH
MTRAGALTGRHVLLAVFGFFGVVFVVNGAFVYFATSSWTGLETNNAYIRGLAYNSVLDAAAAQRERGWDVSLEVAGPGPLTATVAATFADAAGRPLDGLSVTAAFRRPATEGHDLTIALDAGTPGEYGASVELPLAGNWDVRLTARERDVELYIVDRRVWIE